MITIPQGFSFLAARAGFRYSGRRDLGIILSSTPAAAAGVFTTNRFQAAPVLVSRDHLRAGSRARAILVNAGQANACTGEEGIRACRTTCGLAARAFGLEPEEVLPASTGVIGQGMDLELWERGVSSLAQSTVTDDPLAVAQAMLTTDTFPKILWREVALKGGKVRLLGMAKGSGMICPQMATMLGFVCCDADMAPDLWQEMVERATEASFNRISVDGDTSTNDCVLALANGESGIAPAADETGLVEEELTALCQELAYLIVQDAEGGTKVVRIRVDGARDHREAELAARTVGHSPLVKTAMFGRDPNWGRIVAALGRCGADLEPGRVRVSIAGREVFRDGTPVQADIDSLLAPYLDRQEIPVQLTLGQGPGEYEFLTSDLSLDYVRINAEYRS
ncbi:bifunctional glutamate N-acetyltransferase/amino-acid acetyltransferase ArgJ [Desulfovermiculus halophilus]|uniref:bifunctional glutamate N-acetyltransferase/amino-acid acetyltransferase ArgJ n=1 Tax=Desulfovermiculus halophilus TaxID=339722 RepID=UPI000482C53E|nr:bifunctional glutamate N-acetyltransferase/amino-acid acetyltransferase ArgJ [Desulfovermiculus halophilus]